MIKIEKNVPMTEKGQGRPTIYPLADMDVGDSFFVQDKKMAQISPVAFAHGNKYGKKFSCRTMDGGVRVWRVA